MKIAILSTQDIHGGGGYIAAYRLNQGLRQLGLKSWMVVQTKRSDNCAVHLANTSKLARFMSPARTWLDRLPLNLFPKRENVPFSTGWLRGPATCHPSLIEADVVNLHWVCGGFVSIKKLRKINKLIVWTLHDMWPFTGGCHYSGSCVRYRQKCGLCPQLGSKFEYDLSRWVWQHKESSYRHLEITVVTPSKWLAKCASQSSLFCNRRVEVIPYGLNTDLFSPRHDKGVLRRTLGLPENKTLVLFAAAGGIGDPRKGFGFLKQALNKLVVNDNAGEIEFVTIGPNDPDIVSVFGVHTHRIGLLYDEISMANCYGAVDLFVCPSVEDNLPNTILESYACGVPVVAFDTGGISDIIDHKVNGYLAQPLDPGDLSTGILWVLGDKERYRMLSNNARNKAVREYALDIQAQRYRTLLEGISKS